MLGLRSARGPDRGVGGPTRPATACTASPMAFICEAAGGAASTADKSSKWSPPASTSECLSSSAARKTSRSPNRWPAADSRSRPLAADATPTCASRSKREGHPRDRVCCGLALWVQRGDPPLRASLPNAPRGHRPRPSPPRDRDPAAGAIPIQPGSVEPGARARARRPTRRSRSPSSRTRGTASGPRGVRRPISRSEYAPRS